MRFLLISLVVAAVLTAAPGWADECFDTSRGPLQRAGKVRSERIMNGDDTVCATILYYVGTKLSDLIEIYDASGTLRRYERQYQEAIRFANGDENETTVKSEMYLPDGTLLLWHDHKLGKQFLADGTELQECDLYDYLPFYVSDQARPEGCETDTPNIPLERDTAGRAPQLGR